MLGKLKSVFLEILYIHELHLQSTRPDDLSTPSKSLSGFFVQNIPQTSLCKRNVIL